MPSFTNSVANLATVGPLVEVFIGPSALFLQAMAKSGQPVPPPVKAVGMVDTGASGTVLAPGVIAALGLKPIGMTQISTPSTTSPVAACQFNVSIAFPNSVRIGSVIALEAPLGGQHIQCLIGRDVLQLGVLTYIGYINQFTLSF